MASSPPKEAADDQDQPQTTSTEAQMDPGHDEQRQSPSSSSSSATSLHLDRPPAAPMPAPIDLHPPPSPRHRTLDLDEPVGALQGQQPTPTYRHHHHHHQQQPHSPQQQQQHQQQQHDDEDSRYATQGLGVDSSASQSESSPAEEEHMPSSLLVHLGDQADQQDEQEYSESTSTVVSGPAAGIHEADQSLSDSAPEQQQQQTTTQPQEDPDGVGTLPMSTSPTTSLATGQEQATEQDHAQDQGQDDSGMPSAEEEAETSHDASHDAQQDPNSSGNSFSLLQPVAMPTGRGAATAQGPRGGGMIRFRTLQNSNSGTNSPLLQHQQQPPSPQRSSLLADNESSNEIQEQPPTSQPSSQQQQQQPRGIEPTALATQLRNMVASGNANTNLYLFGNDSNNSQQQPQQQSETEDQQQQQQQQQRQQRPSAGPARIKQYAYPSQSDADIFSKEIEEFFSYVEAPQVLENKAAWIEWIQEQASKSQPDQPGQEQKNEHSQEEEQKEEHSPSDWTWTKLPSSVRQRHMRQLLAELANQEPGPRVTASRAFLYLLQGSFADTHDQEHQEHWIKLNTKMAREQGAITAVHEATKKVLWKHDFLSSLPDHVESREPAQHEGNDDNSEAPPPQPLLTPQSKAEYFDEVNMELILCFTQLYLLIETGRRDEEEGGDHHLASTGTGASRLSDDLMNLEPPLPVHLWLVVAGLREKNAKGFPVKKLLLCLWKTLLTCLGGFKDMDRCKALARKVEGLPPAAAFKAPSAQWPPSAFKDTLEVEEQPVSQPYTTAQTQPYHPHPTTAGGDDAGQKLPTGTLTASSSASRLQLGKPRRPRPTKTTPTDFDCFRQELAVKYPTYIPPRRTAADLPIEKVATALDPLPPPRPIGLNGSGDGSSGANGNNGEEGAEGGGGGGGQPATPLPTPPPSPRPNKQKFQTDQSKPFVFPFSASVQGDRMVPYSIEEADRLYAENMYVSTEMWQVWSTREELSREERGISLNDNDKKKNKKGNSLSSLSDRVESRWKSGSSFSSEPFSKATSASTSQFGGSEKPSRSNSHDARGWAGLRALSKLDGASGTSGTDSPRPSGAPGPSSGLAKEAANAAASGTPPNLSSSASGSGTGSPRFMGGFSAAGSEADGGASVGAPVDPEKSFMIRGEPTYERLLEVEAEMQATLARAEGDHLLAVLDNDRFQRTLSILQQQIADVKRLQRVDFVYKAALGHLQSAIIVLLKLLLATVTAQNSNPGGANGVMQDGAGPNGNGLMGGGGSVNAGDDSSTDPNAPIPTVEDVDILRHREITTKAVSAILLISLKWFKTSHAMKFHHVSQFLVDSNCMLLILKMFGLTEIAQHVKTQNEAPNFNFFKYCQLEGHSDPSDQHHEDDEVIEKPQQSAPAEMDDDGLIYDYSYRNFFSILNFTKILQKLTKNKVHRILLLVQYKSSAILKRSLKIPHPTLQLYVLKLIKSQVPFCGRKWRQSNMKVITGIYLNCRPDLRDEWLSTDVDADVFESLPQEQALRSLVKFYINSRFGIDADQQILSSQKPKHPSIEGVSDQNALLPPQVVGDSLTNGDQSGLHNDGGTGTDKHFFESNVWPPLRKGGPGSAGGPGAAAYIPDDIVEGYLGEYEEMLSEVFESSEEGGAVPSDGWSSGKWGLTSNGAATAWNALGEILGQNNDNDGQGQSDRGGEQDSDTESVSSIGELDFSRPNNARGAAATSSATTTSAQDPPLSPSHSTSSPSHRRSTHLFPQADLDEDAESEEGKTNWEHLSPKEMKFLSSSPVISAGSPLGSPTISKLSIDSPGASASAVRSRPSSRRTSSSRSNSDSQPLRPVLDFDAMDLESALQGRTEDVEEQQEEQEEEQQPVVHHVAAQPGGIDEVEHVFGQ
ncbi:unnamed protein product [Sympodiomycopsis kandeliae]